MITITANARRATYKSDDLITSGSVGIPVTFVLSDDFDGLSSIAVFEGSGASVDVALMSNTCEVPPEVVATAGGYLRIGVYARNSEGTIVIPTVWVSTQVILPGAEPSGVDPSQPTPDWTAQVQEAAAEALEIAHRVEDMGATAETLPAGSEATVEKAVDPDTGAITLNFGIPRGDRGEQGPQGVPGERGETGETGPQGVPGTPGQDGFSPTASVTQTSTGATITVTDAHGTTTAEITNGQDGAPGAPGTPGTPGADGFSPTITVTDIPGGHRVTITDATGPHSFDVMDGEDSGGAVQDVQVNGVSVLSDGVANVPVASTTDYGVIKVGQGLFVFQNKLNTDYATDANIKGGTSYYKPITPVLQHYSAFYGLAKASGDTTQSASSNAVGNYTNNAKDKIQQMLGIIDMIAPHEGTQAANAYSVGGAFCHAGKLYKVTTSIAIGDAIVPGTNCTQTTLIELIGGI